MNLSVSAGILALAGFLSAPSQGQALATQGAPATSGVYHANIVEIALANTAYRRVLFTAPRMQVVVMSIPPGGDIGEEQHQHVEQILFAASGEGKAIINGVASPFRSGDVVFVTPGVRHNFINTGKTPLSIYTIYSPPNHLPGRVQATKADAEADAEDAAFGRSVE